MDEVGQNRQEPQKAEEVEEHKRHRAERARAMAVGGGVEYSHENYDYDADDEMVQLQSKTGSSLAGRVSTADYESQILGPAILISAIGGIVFGLLIRLIESRRDASRAVERSTAMKVSVNFHVLVDSVADGFEGQRRVHVNPQARRELILPALPYQAHVEEELAAGQITMEFLRQSLFMVLDNAHQIVLTKSRKEIDGEAIKESMKRYCPYLFWC
jgi:hypothetical protein